MDFAMPDIIFDTTDLALLIADASARSEAGARRADGVDSSGMFGHEDETTLSGAGTDILSWPSYTTFTNASVEAGKDHEADQPSTSSASQQPTSSCKDLLKLNLELLEDQELLDTHAPLTSKHSQVPLCSVSQQHQPINRVLNHTTRFWDMLKNMSVATEAQQHRFGARYEGTTTGSSSSNSGSNSGSNSSIRRGWTWAGTADTNYLANADMDSCSSLSSLSPPRRQDHLLIVNLVTTYVYLVRSCQAVFTRLYHALEMTPAAEASSVLNLPSLQFGRFQLDNNLAIQVKVLIELTSSMLLRIGNALGISPAGVISGVSSPTEDRDYRLPILGDPVAVSIREIILSQERMQGGMQNGDLPLLDIMNNLKRLLERR
jgi:hypothetical protein